MYEKLKKIVPYTFFIVLFFGSVSVFARSANSQVDTMQAAQQVEHITTLPEVYMVLPFVLLLLMIATGPLFYKHFWERHYPKVSIILGAFVVIYYLAVLNNEHILMHTLAEYISFIALLGSLFVASGGILIKVDKESTPMLNLIFLLFGAVI
jgi:hypothetical protein